MRPSSTPTTPSMLGWSRIAHAGLVGFFVLFGVAAALYPGGTQFDRAAAGFTVGENFFCDLFRARALNGESARLGAWLAQLGALSVVVAIYAGFRCAALFAASAGYARVLLAMATVACVGMIAIPLTPSDRFGHLHFIVVGLAAVPALIAFAMASRLMLRASAVPPWATRLTLVAVVLSLLHFSQYLAEASFGAVVAPTVPPVQTLVALVDLVWVGAVAWLAR